MSEKARRKGLPGGIALPASLFLGFASLFVFTYIEPGAITLPFMSPGGIGVLGMSATAFWLLVAIAKRPPPSR